MNGTWQCAVCEAINHDRRACSACGATMTRRSAAATVVRARVAPIPTPVEPAPLPPPVRRAINREPVDEVEWEEYDSSFEMLPVPGGCLFSLPSRRSYF
jgi:hypothetical protein